jgi:hypothetical protein
VVTGGEVGGVLPPISDSKASYQYKIIRDKTIVINKLIQIDDLGLGPVEMDTGESLCSRGQIDPSHGPLFSM